MTLSPSDYFNKYKDKTRSEIIEFLNTLLKEQKENDGGTLHLPKLLSNIFFADVQYEGVFQETGDFAIIHDVILSSLQKSPLPNPIRARDGTIIGGNGSKSEDKTSMEFVISSVEYYYGMNINEILQKQAESTIAPEEDLTTASGGSTDDAIAVAQFGLGKWGGGRLESFMNWCFNNGFDPYNENVQIIYIIEELLNTPDAGLEDIMKSDNFTDAVTAFSVFYQKDADPDRIREKIEFASEIYARYYI